MCLPIKKLPDCKLIRIFLTEETLAYSADNMKYILVQRNINPRTKTFTI